MTISENTMRRNDRAISREEAEALLEKAEYGILSMASTTGEPYGIPLNFCMMNTALYFHCAMEGRKVEMLARNKAVSFCVVGETEVLTDQFAMKYESVIVSGNAQEVTGEEKQSALEVLVKKYSPAFHAEGIAKIAEDAEKTIVYKIVINTITGKARR
jgi:nitroimidazol reductase NimA-like FMN-containing flavoprotein (pyridoxamine 5'-phosphate oxidase superfamily)